MDELHLPRLPGHNSAAYMHLLFQVGRFRPDDECGKLCQEAALEFRASAVGTDLMVGRFGQQQKAVIGNTAGLHVGSNDAGGLA